MICSGLLNQKRGQATFIKVACPLFCNAVLFFALATGLCACASTSTITSGHHSPAVPLTPPEGYVLYTVQRGETLWRIARRTRIELEDLIRLNRIADAKKIDVGQILVVPQASEANFAAPSSEGLDFAWPVEGKVVAYFRDKMHGVANKGIDIQARPGDEIHAARSGRVAFIGKLPGYGTTIVLDHGDGFSTIYCGTQDITVRVDDPIESGIVLARAGDRARHLDGQVHFEIRRRHKPQNPLFFLD